MSSKATIILTPENEHWYRETNENDNGENRVYIEIDPSNIKSFDSGSYGLIVGIRGDSKLAKLIQTMQDDETPEEVTYGESPVVRLLKSEGYSMVDLARKSMQLCRARGWSLDLFNRHSKHTLEVAELIEAIRGKRGDKIEEAGDALITLLAILQSNDIPVLNALNYAHQKVEKLMDAPRYEGEDYRK